MTTTTTAAALRSRTLPALGSPFALLTDQDPWRARPSHNSITAALRSAVVQLADVTPAVAGGVYKAGKQAAPPRGVPR